MSFFKKGEEMKIVITIMTLLVSNCFGLKDNTVLRNRATHITEELFGSHGLHIGIQEKDKIADLLFNLYVTSPYEQQKIAEKTALSLAAEYAIKKAHLSLTHKQEQIGIEQSLFVIEQERSFFEHFSIETKKKLTWLDRLEGRLHEFFKNLKHIFGFEAQSSIATIAAQLTDYARFEREEIFGDYHKTALYYRRHKVIPLPPLMKIWGNQQTLLTLLGRIRRFGTNVKLSMAEAGDVAFDVVGAGEGATLDSLMQSAAQEAENFSSTIIDSMTSDTLPSTTGESGASSMGQEVTDTVSSALTNAGSEGGSQALTDLSTDLKNATAGQLPTAPTPPSGTLDENAFQELTGEEPGPADSSTPDPEPDPSATPQEKQDGILKSGAKKTWNALKRAKNAIGTTYDKYLATPYKNYIYKNLEWIEKNALKQAMDSLPWPLRMAADMGLQMGIMNGGGLVVYWADQKDQAAFDALVKQNQQNTELLKKNQATLTGKKMAALQQANTNFGQSIAALSTDYQDIQSRETLELLYVEHSLITQQPQPYFIVDDDALSVDQRFALSTMYNIPEQSPTLVHALPTLGAWHNIFRVGNWEYMNTGGLNGFYQVNAAPLTAPQNNGPSLAAQALYNAIFTEYIPPDLGTTSYTIEVHVTFNRITYPFFVGVLFNNARWISGVTDRYNQQRFAGFYGDANKNVYAVAVESANSTPAQITAKLPNVQSPFFRILNAPTNYTQNPVTLGTLPATYVFTIQTTPTQATFTFGQNTTSSTQPASSLTTITASNLNAAVFNFHGIGLVSAGCAASFTIIQPTELNYASTH